jgi:hypothetical protein
MKVLFFLWAIPALAHSLANTLSFVTFVGSLAVLLSPSVSALNSIVFTNHCPYDIFLWTVGPPNSNLIGQDNESTTIPGNNTSVVHPMVNTEPLGSGMTLKLRDLPEYRVAPAGIVQVEYHFEPSTDSVWYDMSVVDCDQSRGPEQPSYCPLLDGGINLHVPGVAMGHCPPAWCNNDGCKHVYTEHGTWPNEPTLRCNIPLDIVIETCVDGPGPRTFHGAQSVLPSADLKPSEQPSELSLDGTCGANSGRGSVCRGSTRGNCCSGTSLHCSLDTINTDWKQSTAGVAIRPHIAVLGVSLSLVLVRMWPSSNLSR